jgi:thioredoxin 1
MIERFLILLLCVAIAAAAYLLWHRYQRRRLTLVSEQVTPPEVKRLVDPSRPAVLYFTTPECAQCRLQQAPILNQLAAKLDVAVHKLDAVEQDALARFYGIMTVPTTVVLDLQLRPVAVNHGVTPLPKLLAQVGGAQQ